jgi:hypothetical protein
MDALTIILACTVVLGGWAMYTVGYMRGVARGRDIEAEILSKIEYERRRRGGI